MKVLLAVDDSKHSEDAVHGLAYFFKPQSTEVRIIQVLRLPALTAPPQMSREYAPELDDLAKDAHALVDKYSAQLRAVGFRVDSVVERGEICESVIDYADGWRADLIVIGSGGHKGVGRLLFGSVADSVVREAHCSVLVVRGPSKE
jgi:nucleotide-binding universal stress UspA family protein